VKIECKVDEKNRQRDYHLDGELDVHQAKLLKERLVEDLEEIQEGSWVIRLHMENVQYLDSSGLGMLVYLKKEIKLRHGKLHIDGLKDAVYNVFKLTRLDEFFELPKP